VEINSIENVVEEINWNTLFLMLQQHGSSKHRYACTAFSVLYCCLYEILDHPGICPVVEDKDRKFVKLLQLNLNIHNNPVESVLFRCKSRIKISKI